MSLLAAMPRNDAAEQADALLARLHATVGGETPVGPGQAVRPERFDQPAG